MKFRIAHPSESNQINAFIYESKGFWGYEKAFLEAFISRWGVTEEYLKQNHVILYEDTDDILGLYAFQMEENSLMLDLFFVNTSKIQQGIGRYMWCSAIDEAISQGHTSFSLIADPNSEIFYKKMGAKTIKEFESFPGRLVPIMSVNLEILGVQSLPASDDIEAMNELIKRSRHSVGYDEANNNHFIKMFGIQYHHLTSKKLSIFKKEGKIVALYGFTPKSRPYLDYFFIDPDLQSKGAGSLMWKAVCGFASKQGWKHFEFICNPHSIAFYEKMGATIREVYVPEKNQGMVWMEYQLIP